MLRKTLLTLSASVMLGAAVAAPNAALAQFGPPPGPPPALAGSPPGLALQLHFSSEVSAASVGLVSSSPERPCENMVDRDAPLSELDNDATDFLDRPADQERRLGCRRGGVFLSAGSALARWRMTAIMAKASMTRETWRCQPCQERVSL
jgi:hypothetical protein